VKHALFNDFEALEEGKVARDDDTYGQARWHEFHFENLSKRDLKNVV
jgi:hypothetical protein